MDTIHVGLRDQTMNHMRASRTPKGGVRVQHPTRPTSERTTPWF